jgi:hypothetical protein
MTTSRSKPENVQEELFQGSADPPARRQDPDDDEPKPNSPEDLGLVTPIPAGPLYGQARDEPDPLPENFARSAIQHEDAVRFRDWIFDQDLPTHAQVTIGWILTDLSGIGQAELRWLCQAIRQAGRAPSPATMKRAVLTHDVSVLREDEI